jgi:glutamine amidotransferase
MPAPAAVYFVHSYAARPADPECVAATTDYGGPVVAAVARDNVWAVQFHPEKSSAAGLVLLAGFVAAARKARGWRTPLDEARSGPEATAPEERCR